MRRASLILLIGAVCVPVPASAGNSDEVNAGLDVTLTGGAVVANVYTGAALWYNPAGIARVDKSSLELTGITFQTRIAKVPGLLSLESGEKSGGKTVNFSVIPEALTFTIVLRPNLKLGVGLFNSSIRRVFITDEVMSAEGSTPVVEAVGGQNTRFDFFHVSAGLAGEFGKKQKVLFGGAFDFVVATSRADGTLAVLYDGGESGFFTDGETVTQTGFGLQLKAGLQWVPIEEVRIGLSVASPTYVFAILERFATTFGQSPPAGIVLPSDDPNAQASGGEEFRGARGGWWGVEPGNMRVGIAYVGGWGWIEGDVVLQWRLRTSDLGIDLRGLVNGRIGSAFRLTKFVKLGIGAFTDRSQVDQLAVAPFATTDVNFYGVHLGFLFSNQEVHPDRPDLEAEEKDGIGIAIAVGLRYAHGRGQVLGLVIPAQYDPSSITATGINGKINEISINLGAKVLF